MRAPFFCLLFMMGCTDGPVQVQGDRAPDAPPSAVSPTAEPRLPEMRVLKAVGFSSAVLVEVGYIIHVLDTETGVWTEVPWGKTCDTRTLSVSPNGEYIVCNGLYGRIGDSLRELPAGLPDAIDESSGRDVLGWTPEGYLYLLRTENYMDAALANRKESRARCAVLDVDKSQWQPAKCIRGGFMEVIALPFTSVDGFWEVVSQQSDPLVELTRFNWKTGASRSDYSLWGDFKLLGAKEGGVWVVGGAIVQGDALPPSDLERVEGPGPLRRITSKGVEQAADSEKGWPVGKYKLWADLGQVCRSDGRCFSKP